MKTIDEQLIAYLKDVHALEQLSLHMTKAAAKATDDPRLRALFEHHHKETEEHERLIRERIEAHGESPSMLKDAGARVAALGTAASTMAPDAPARLARDGYVQEQAEIASYQLLASIAEHAGDRPTAEVARRILENERDAAEKIAGTWNHVAELSLAQAA